MTKDKQDLIDTLQASKEAIDERLIWLNKTGDVPRSLTLAQEAAQLAIWWALISPGGTQIDTPDILVPKVMVE